MLFLVVRSFLSNVLVDWDGKHLQICTFGVVQGIDRPSYKAIHVRAQWHCLYASTRNYIYASSV